MDDVRTPPGTIAVDVERLLGRSLPDGGFTDRPGGTYRTDATAWAAIVLDAVGQREAYSAAAKRLATDQSSDGRVPISPRHPGAWWPTALAVVAWAGVDSSRLEKDRAVQFLLHVNGTTAQKQVNDPTGHDTTLRGWSWIEGTHSWIEPTSLSLLAFAAAGINEHPRIDEAIRLLLNRQLPQGGWNYGNTTMFGHELHPMPESTGVALAALAGKVPPSDTARSLEYLRGSVDQLRTPIALGWSLLGLAAWNNWPSNGEALVHRCLSAQSRYGEYDTASLCLMLMAAVEGGAGRFRP
jgi:hypothetical protein